MTSQSEQTLLILGASGDLSARLLLPGLGGLLASGGGEGVSLWGSGSDDWDDDRWRARVGESFAAAGATGDAVEAVVRSARYTQADVTDASEWRRLLGDLDGRVVIYFALAPAVTELACQALTGLELPAGSRLAFEKPFGTDAASAEALNRVVDDLVPEQQVHRADHFLATSTVMNIAGVRFANRILEPLLSAEHVESVDIVFDETLGLEGRAGYYDKAGALVDMIQSHLLQVLSVVAMEPPNTLDARDVRDARSAVLRATKVWKDDPIASSFRARYTAGEIDGRRLPSYSDEEGIPVESRTETLAELVLEVDTARWAGVPFRLRSGKAIGDPRQEIVVTFKEPRLLPTGFSGREEPDRLRIGIALDGGRLDVDVNVNGPGDPTVLEQVSLGSVLGPGELPEYGEVLKSIFAADPSLSVRGDAAVDCWRIIEPAIAAWRENLVPLQEYPAGSAGPEGWPF